MRLPMRSLSPTFIPMRVLPCALAVALAACTLEPTYQRPDAPIPSAYPQGAAYNGAKPGAASGAAAQPAQAGQPQPAGPSAADLGWRDVFVDPNLRQLIEQ